MHDKKIFPIQSKTACLLKWSWSTVFLSTGRTSSCHRVDQDVITPSTFQTFHNTPRKLATRQAMREGQWPGHGCEYCKKIEDAGGISDRMYQLETGTYRSPAELFENPELNEVVPTTLEVYFSNTCNMACLYCGPHFSSTWEAENKRFPEFKHGNIELFHGYNKLRLIEYQEMLDQFWSWLGQHHGNLQYLHILGGEPFYQTELLELFDFLDKHPSPNLHLVLISNLKVAPTKFRAIIDRMMDLKHSKKINDVQITGSLDCWGPQAEFVRWGLDLKEYTTNMEYMLTQDITICVNGAISALTIKTMPEYIEQIKYWNSLKANSHIHYSFMSVTDPYYMAPDIFGGEVFKEDFEKILSAIPKDDYRYYQNYMHMSGIAKQIAAAKPNPVLIDELKVYLNEIDRRRGTDWKSLFPWINDLQYTL